MKKTVPYVFPILRSAALIRYGFFTILSGIVLYACSSTEKDEAPLLQEMQNYLSLASSFQHTEPDSVLKYTDLIRKHPNAANLQQLVFYLRSGAHRYKGNLSLAIKDCHEARNRIGFTQADTLDAEILFLSAQLFTDIGQYDDALGDYQQSISIFEQLNHPIGQGKCLNSIALIYYRLDDLEKAQQYSDEALLIWNVHPHPLGIASSYTINGYVFSKRQEYDLAIANLEKASAIYTEINDRERYANSLLNTGEVYLKQKQYSKAQELFEKSLQLSRQLNYRQIYVDGLNKLGQCYTKQQKYQLAEDSLRSGLAKAEEIMDRALLGEFYHHLSQLHQATGNYQRAFDFQQKYSHQKDSIFKSERNLRIAEFEVKYQTAEVNQKNKILQEKNQQRLIYIGFLSLLSLLILSLVFLIYSRYRIKIKYLRQEKVLQETNLRQQKLENEKLESDTRLQEEENKKLHLKLDHKQKELSNVTLYLYQKNENLSQLMEELKRMESSSDKGNKKNLQILKRSIQNNLNLDQDWERFKTHFDQVHEGFIEKLYQQFPALTAQDLRHCAYIRMNLSTKEISRLINITPASVQKSRVRLKKKLHLGKEVDLFHFILNF